MGAPVAWFEITGQDPKGLAHFYPELFEFGRFAMLADPEGHVVGLWS